jgi:hypothetical protein
LDDLKAILRTHISAGEITEKPSQEDGFQEVRRRKTHNTTEAAPTCKKPVPTGASAPSARTRRRSRPAISSPHSVQQKWTQTLPAVKPLQVKQHLRGKKGRPPPIILTSAVNFIQLQKQLKGVVSEDFKFRSTRNGTRVITRGMADFQSVKSYFNSHNLSYFPFFPKDEKTIKAVIRHLPQNTPAQDISDELVNLGLDVINVKQMTTTRRSPQETKIITLPLFLITLPRTPKSQEIIRLQSLCHIAIRVEACRNQNSLTQCHNCQQFGHVWANSKQPPRCLWCGGGHLHKECPEKGNASSTPACCNCRLADGENYRGCSRAKEELQKKKLQKPRRVLFCPHHPRRLLRGGTPRQRELLVLVIYHRHEPHRKRLLHYCILSRFRENNVSTELFPNNGCCTVACLHSCYLAMLSHVTVSLSDLYSNYL